MSGTDRQNDPEAGPPEMVKGVGVPGRRPRTHAPNGWPGPVDFPLDPGRPRRNGIVVGVVCIGGLASYFALGGGAAVGMAVGLGVILIAAGAVVRVQGEASALRFTREGIEYLGTRPPKRLKWSEISDIDLVDLPNPFGKDDGDADQVVRLMLENGEYDVIPTGHKADVNGLAWIIEGWWRYATRPW